MLVFSLASPWKQKGCREKPSHRRLFVIVHGRMLSGQPSDFSIPEKTDRNSSFTMNWNRKKTRKMNYMQ